MTFSAIVMRCVPVRAALSAMIAVGWIEQGGFGGGGGLEVIVIVRGGLV